MARLFLIACVFLFLPAIAQAQDMDGESGDNVVATASEDTSDMTAEDGAPTGTKQEPVGQPMACPQDAKQCPDGSYVSRVPPYCEFAECGGDGSKNPYPSKGEVGEEGETGGESGEMVAPPASGGSKGTGGLSMATPKVSSAPKARKYVPRPDFSSRILREKRVKISTADRACETDNDCVLVPVKCKSCHCGMPVHIAEAEKYLEMQENMCAGWMGEDCHPNCDSLSATPVCDKGRCRNR